MPNTIEEIDAVSRLLADGRQVEAAAINAVLQAAVQYAILAGAERRSDALGQLASTLGRLKRAVQQRLASDGDDPDSIAEQPSVWLAAVDVLGRTVHGLARQIRALPARTPAEVLRASRFAREIVRALWPQSEPVQANAVRRHAKIPYQGTLYRIMRSWEDAGVVSSSSGEAGAALYLLTAEGRRVAEEVYPDVCRRTDVGLSRLVVIGDAQPSAPLEPSEPQRNRRTSVIAPGYMRYDVELVELPHAR
jgi:hypothetical protein